MSNKDQPAVRKVQSTYICCRKFFYQKQKIVEPQTATIQYKNYKSPYDKYCTKNLKKTICGFLNRAGGSILIGIYQATDNKYKQVRGQFITESQKQQILKDFRVICSDISPDIVCNSKYNVKYVPIKKSTQQYIPGKYIVRVSIKQGNKQQLYSYKQQQDRKIQYIATRTINQVLKKQICQQILSIYKQKLLNPSYYEPTHKGECPQPDIGKPIIYNQNILYDNYNDYDYDQYDQYQQKYQKPKYIEKYIKNNLNINSNSQIINQKYNKNNQFVRENRKQLLGKKNNEQKIIQFNPKPKQMSNTRKFHVQQQTQEQIKKKINLQKLLSQIDNQYDYNGKLDFVSLKNSTNTIKSIKDNNYIRQNQSKYKKIEQKNKYYFKKINEQKIDYQYKYQNKKQNNKQTQNQQESNFNKKNSIKIQERMSPTQYLNQQKENNHIKKYQNYKKNKDIMQLIIVNVPFSIIQQLTVFYKLTLIQQPIMCGNDQITWLRIDRRPQGQKQRFFTFYDRVCNDYKNKASQDNKKIIIRKVYQILKFEYNQKIIELIKQKLNFMPQLVDRNNICYFKLNTIYQSIKIFLYANKKKINAQFIDKNEKLFKIQQQQYKYRRQQKRIKNK